MENTKNAFIAAANHHGTSVVEVLQNCVIYNDKVHSLVATKQDREENTILLKHGEKMLFGKENKKGLVLDGWSLKAVNVGEDGYTIEDVLVHDAQAKDSTLQLKLGMMSPKEGLPLALGVIRDVQELVYEEELEKQITGEKNKKPNMTLKDHLLSKNTWEMK